MTPQPHYFARTRASRTWTSCGRQRKWARHDQEVPKIPVVDQGHLLDP